MKWGDGWLRRATPWTTYQASLGCVRRTGGRRRSLRTDQGAGLFRHLPIRIEVTRRGHFNPVFKEALSEHLHGL